MTNRVRLLIAFSSLVVALAPAPQEPRPVPAVPARPDASLAELRIEAGTKAYEMTWLYYSENRVDSEKVYRWSRRLLEAQREANLGREAEVAACQAHLERISKLGAKIDRIRRLGFGNSLDVVENEYYVREAELWLERARAAR
jgi:hypothetical protein